MGRTYPNEIDRILKYPGGDVGKECRRVALATADEAARVTLLTLGHHPGDAPRTLRLATSYRVEVISGTNQFIVKNPVKYAAAIEKGARAHDIRPRRTSYLQFRGRDGRWRKIKVVHHPGNLARNILSNAAYSVVKRFYG